VVNSDVPVGFELDDEEQACFVSYLQQRDAWTVAERHQLAHLAKAETLIARQRAAIAEEGELITLPNTIRTMNPRFKILAQTERYSVQLMSKLGFGIESRDAERLNNRSMGAALVKKEPPKPTGPAPDWSKLAKKL
jgi:hypothetical protein